MNPLSLKMQIIAGAIIFALVCGFFLYVKSSSYALGKADCQAAYATAQAEQINSNNKTFRKVQHEAPRNNDAYGIADWLLRHAIGDELQP